MAGFRWVLCVSFASIAVKFYREGAKVSQRAQRWASRLASLAYPPRPLRETVSCKEDDRCLKTFFFN